MGGGGRTARGGGRKEREGRKRAVGGGGGEEREGGLTWFGSRPTLLMNTTIRFPTAFVISHAAWRTDFIDMGACV